MSNTVWIMIALVVTGYLLGKLVRDFIRLIAESIEKSEDRDR